MLRFLQGFLCLMLLVGCGSEAPAPSTAPEAPAPVATEAPVASAPPWHAALQDPQRPDADRDAARKPVEVIEFLGIEPGMTVMDMFTAGGYYTEVLAAAVGSEGRVYAHNIAFLLEMFEGRNAQALEARLADDRLPNVVRHDAELTDMGLAPNSLDAITFALNFHDVYNGRGDESALATLGVMQLLVKPGGVIGLIDHVGAPDGDNEALHRIDPEIVRDLIARAGLVLEAESDVLANADDDHTQNVFAEAMRGNTDRFVWRIRVPDAAAAAEDLLDAASAVVDG